MAVYRALGIETVLGRRCERALGRFEPCAIDRGRANRCSHHAASGCSGYGAFGRLRRPGPELVSVHDARPRMASARLREELRRTGLYQVLDNAPAATLIEHLKSQQRYWHDCNGCDLEVGRQLGADRVLVVWVDRVVEIAGLRDVEWVMRVFGRYGRSIAESATRWSASDWTSWSRTRCTRNALRCTWAGVAAAARFDVAA